MVNISKTLLSLLAVNFIGRSYAYYDHVNQRVGYVPLVHEWTEGGNLTATFDVVNPSYILFHDTNLNKTLDKRLEISVEAWATLASISDAVIATNAVGNTIYKAISSLIKSKSDTNTCSLTTGTDSNGLIHEGYAYKATTTNKNCDTTAELKTIEDALSRCANYLHRNGAVTGCCRFSHGGTWTGHLQLSADPKKYPVTDVGSC